MTQAVSEHGMPLNGARVSGDFVQTEKSLSGLGLMPFENSTVEELDILMIPISGTNLAL